MLAEGQAKKRHYSLNAASGCSARPRSPGGLADGRPGSVALNDSPRFFRRCRSADTTILVAETDAFLAP
jgi:hypothetical protein